MLNNCTLSLDISTTTIGICLFNEKGDLEEITYVSYKAKAAKELDLFQKADLFEEKIKHMKNANINHIAIEEPLKRVQGKFSNAQTLSLLNFFNGMISDRVYKMFGVRPVHYNVRHARSTVFNDIGNVDKDNIKNEIWKRVQRLEPHVNWIYGKKSLKLSDENYDMCDAYVIGYCHLINLDNQEKMLLKEGVSKN